jgi:hypothetical protein
MRFSTALPLLLALFGCNKDLGHDADGDGWPAAIDCDDDAADVNPGVAETCNGVDDDCDQRTDVDAIDGTLFYEDLDGDGAGGDRVTMVACQSPEEGWTTEATDCDDLDAGAFPGAVEICDGVDQDCDGTADEDTGAAPTWYEDVDADGFGDSFHSLTQCDRPAGYVPYGGDCDDDNPARNPAASEICNDEDDDCNGVGDENPIDGVVWYGDLDGDGFAGERVSVVACQPPDGTWLTTADDCDDLSPSVNPDAVETCDGVDQDCDGTVDDGAGTYSVFADADGDGFGDPGAPLTGAGCTPPGGTVANSDDCDDLGAAVHPGAVESCDGVDEDCDGAVDDDAVGATTWFRDADGDGFAGSGETVAACAQPAGYEAAATDCDDFASRVNPGAVEVCDGFDDDCDGTVDVGASDVLTFYQDGDGDGFGDALTVFTACEAGAAVTMAGDCDDADASLHPYAPEICDGLDDDCDGDTDDADSGRIGGTVWYVDADGDGAGDAATLVVACDGPTGAVSTAGDCDDDDPARFPGAVEVCDAADIDEDCDGAAEDYDADSTGGTAFEVDADQDGYGDDTLASVPRCDPAVGFAVAGGDCDDADPSTNPGISADGDATTADGVDNDCDSQCDEDFIAANPGVLVITEVMYEPDWRYFNSAALNANLGDWFEVYNTSNEDLRLCSGWIVSSAGGANEKSAITSDVVVPAHGLVVFGASDNPTINGGVAVDVVYGTAVKLEGPAYCEDTTISDRVSLSYGAVANVVDAVAWDYGSGWPTPCSFGDNMAMALDLHSHDASSNDDPFNWCGVYGGGSPGVANTVCSGGS